MPNAPTRRCSLTRPLTARDTCPSSRSIQPLKIAPCRCMTHGRATLRPVSSGPKYVGQKPRTTTASSTNVSIRENRCARTRLTAAAVRAVTTFS